MARLEQLVKSFVELFEEYADGDGNLNKEELKKLFEKEIECSEMKAKICAADCKKIMKRDKDRDGEINFREFSRCMCFIANCYYRKKTGRGEECDNE